MTKSTLSSAKPQTSHIAYAAMSMPQQHYQPTSSSYAFDLDEDEMQSLSTRKSETMKKMDNGERKKKKESKMMMPAPESMSIREEASRSS